MNSTQIKLFLQNVLANLPSDWIKLTTHRLDIYDERLAKTQFLSQFESLLQSGQTDTIALSQLPTAYDYIRLGHPLSCVLEWAIAKINQLHADQVISFSSKTAPILAVLRKNLFLKKNTQILFKDDISGFFGAELVKQVYGYSFEMKEVEIGKRLPDFDGSRIFISQTSAFGHIEHGFNCDFVINTFGKLGSVIHVLDEKDAQYIPEIWLPPADFPCSMLS